MFLLIHPRFLLDIFNNIFKCIFLTSKSVNLSSLIRKQSQTISESEYFVRILKLVVLICILTPNCPFLEDVIVCYNFCVDGHRIIKVVNFPGI